MDVVSLDDPELTARIRKIAMAHNRANVPIESYDALASSTMIALKRLLGSEFTFDTREVCTCTCGGLRGGMGMGMGMGSRRIGAVAVAVAIGCC